MKMLLWAIGFCLVAAWPLPADARVNIARIPRCSTAPVLDGAIGESEWEKAAVLPWYCGLEERLSARRTTTYAMYDQENLYIAFRANVDFDPEFKPVGHDDPKLPMVDAFSMNFKHIGTSLNRQFRVERAGGISDCLWDLSLGLGNEDFSWNPAWQVVSHLTPQAFLTNYIWEVEAAIPWRALELVPEPGVEFGAQFVHYFGKGSEFGERAATWTAYTNPWGIFGFGGDFILAGEDWPCFRFQAYDGFQKGRAGVAGQMTTSDAVTLALDVELSGHDAPVVFQQRFDGNKIDFMQALPVTVPVDATAQWWLSDEHGPVAGARFRTVIAPAFNVGIEVNHYEDNAVFCGDLRGLDELPADAEVVCEVLDATGIAVAEKRFPAVLPGFEVWLPLSAIPAGSIFTARSRLTGSGAVGEAARTFEHLARPEWLDYAGGEFDTPDPATGWHPVSIAGDDALRRFTILENSGAIGVASPLPEAITIRGRDFTFAPFRFVVESAGGERKFRAEKVEQIERDGRGVTLRWLGSAADGMTLEARIRIEFDGLIWYKLALRHPGGAPVEVRRVAIEMPLRADALRYARGYNGLDGEDVFLALVGAAETEREIVQPDIPYVLKVSGDGWHYNRDYAGYYWLGDDRGGIYLILPSRYNIAVDGDYSRAEESGDEFRFTVNLIDHEQRFADGLDYEFGFMLTPSKLPADRMYLWRGGICYRDWMIENGEYVNRINPKAFDIPEGARYFGQDRLEPFPDGYLSCIGIQCVQTQIGNPFPPESEREIIRRESAKIRRGFGAQPLLWYDSLFTMVAVPELAPYCADWERSPTLRMQVEAFGGGVCATRAWQNCYLAGVERFIGDGAGSFYMDLSGLSPCRNRYHGHGWRDSGGEWQSEIPFLETREFFLRYQHLIKRNDPRAMLYLHGNPFTPLMTWMDVVTFGEEWSLVKDYSTLTPEYFQLAFTAAENLGVPINFFAPLTIHFYSNAKTSAVDMEESCGLAFVHGESVYPALEVELAGPRLVWDALAAFDAYGAGAEWIPYWRNPRSLYPEGVMVSSWKRPDGEMLAIFNPAYDTVELTPEIFAGLTDIRDEIGTGNGDLRHLKARGFLLLRTGNAVEK